MIILLRKLKPLGKSFLFYNPLYLIMFVLNLAQRVSQRTNCQFLDFTPVTLPEIKTILSQMNITTCPLDPFPTSILIDSDVWLDWLVYIVNMSLSTGIFPIVTPLLKKPTLDCTSFKNLRPVSNIAFMSKVIEKVIAFQLHSHMTRHNMFEESQLAHKAHHSTETTLVKEFNDIMLNVDSGSGSFLILLDLSSAFDIIDYDMLCTVFERYLGMSGTALKLLVFLNWSISSCYHRRC